MIESMVVLRYIATFLLLLFLQMSCGSALSLNNTKENSSKPIELKITTFAERHRVVAEGSLFVKQMPYNLIPNDNLTSQYKFLTSIDTIHTTWYQHKSYYYTWNIDSINETYRASIIDSRNLTKYTAPSGRKTEQIDTICVGTVYHKIDSIRYLRDELVSDTLNVSYIQYYSFSGTTRRDSVEQHAKYISGSHDGLALTGLCMKRSGYFPAKITHIIRPSQWWNNQKHKHKWHKFFDLGSNVTNTICEVKGPNNFVPCITSIDDLESYVKTLVPEKRKKDNIYILTNPKILDEY